MYARNFALSMDGNGINENHEDGDGEDDEDSEIYFRAYDRRKLCNITSCRRCNLLWKHKRVRDPIQQFHMKDRRVKPSQLQKCELNCEFCTRLIVRNQQRDALLVQNKSTSRKSLKAQIGEPDIEGRKIKDQVSIAVPLLEEGPTPGRSAEKMDICEDK